jgi:hypothetical protein
MSVYIKNSRFFGAHFGRSISIKGANVLNMRRFFFIVMQTAGHFLQLSSGSAF